MFRYTGMKIIFYFSFILSTFVGAFLLFQVQPIITKYILPWFGGSSSVWITALLFFQIVLLLGYSYTFLLTRFKKNIQVIFHFMLVLLATALIVTLYSRWQSPITPPLEWKFSNTISPIIQVVGILAISVGLPYFILSTTSTLLQKWFSSVGSPYPLYALSNFGSLLGIVSYPFLIEPWLSLSSQGLWWSNGFVVYSILLSICCISVGMKSFKISSIKKGGSHVERKRCALWVFLSTASSLMLLSTTYEISQSVAAVPFLWLLPLSLYLLSFIVCFSGTRWYWRNVYSYTFFLSAFFVMALSIQTIVSLSLVLELVIYSVLLFSSFMLCHGKLYHLKPHIWDLNLYYLLIAAGGALGGVIAGIFAPLFFKGPWEFYLGISLCGMTATLTLFQDKQSFLYQSMMHRVFTSKKEMYSAIVLFFVTFFFLFSFIDTYKYKSGYTSVQTFRNFYATLRVTKKETKDPHVSYLSLINGKITHGAQFDSGPLRTLPTMYFSKKTGVGLAILNYPERTSVSQENGLSIGIIGLGIGTLAAYGSKGDYMKFYEINPEVEKIARSYFTYLKDSSAKIDIVIGDGRISLEKEVKDSTIPPYDILVVDAFSDDAIPVHLLTKEAFDTYLKRLSAIHGLLAIHISNRYVNLLPVLVRIAEHFGMELALIETSTKEETAASQWVLLTHDKEYFKAPAIAHAKSALPKHAIKIPLWTDDYSNLFQILK